MNHTSTNDTFGTTINFLVSEDGGMVRYWSDDLPGVHVDIYPHEDGNPNMVEADLNFAGVVGNGGGHERTMLLNIHESVDTIHGIFAGLLS